MCSLFFPPGLIADAAASGTVIVNVVLELFKSERVDERKEESLI